MADPKTAEARTPSTNPPPALAPLAPHQLSRRCDPATLDFETTAELPDYADGLGQERAAEAVRFAFAVDHPGYNLFVLGEPGSGRHALIERLLGEHARSETVAAPSDWCYINNFAEASKPRVLRLPAGRGRRLRDDMQQFVAELGQAISAGFESDEHRSRIEAIQEQLKQREESSLRELGNTAMKQGVALLRTPQGFTFAPLKGEEPMEPADFDKLPEEERKRLNAAVEELGEQLGKLLHQFPRWRREAQTRVKQTSRDSMSLAVGHLIEELKERYTDLPNVLAFLDEVLHDIVETGEELRDSQKTEGELVSVFVSGELSLQRYHVNLLVDNAPGDEAEKNAGKTTHRPAPLVNEDHPSFPNLVGRVDSISHLGTVVTNFTLIKPGALHLANGGTLLLDLLKLLAQPYAWEGLKRALRTREIRIESLGQVYGWGASVPLEPEPIPLDVKVVLFGERYYYYLLSELDPEFAELFKVAADFEDELERSDANVRHYAQTIVILTRRDKLRPFSRGAVARLIEQGSRIAGDAERITLLTRRIADLMREAEHHAKRENHASVKAEDVEAAVAAQRRRAERIPGRIREEMLRGTLLIASAGTHIGQVNGLAVAELGGFSFGHPVRISATARLGEGEVVDIERETELGGAIHSKGMMILSSFLAARYSRETPLSLSASIVFEQSYGPVEGDSASLAELCALLSAISTVPIRQSLAVTGSINQYGRVQAIGGVNEKIEGFFDICQARGLTGEQGVIIPESNVKHLMLKREVVEAAEQGKFRIYAVADVDQAIALLTGVPAGEPDANGLVPADTINYLVATQLAQLSQLRHEYGSGTTTKKRTPKAKDSKEAKPDTPDAPA